MNLSRRYHLNIKLSTFIGPSLKIQLPFLVQQNLELQLPSELLQTFSYSVKYTPILQTHSQNAKSTLRGANIIQKYMMI